MAVTLTATSIIASSNRVECERETRGMELNVIGKNTFTVVGNITGGQIFINGAVLSGVWPPLNITP